MKLILAQGNPGPDYAQTRHNVGFLALDFYAHQHQLAFQPKPKFYADIAETIYKDQKILLAKPTTYYNETGQSARAIPSEARLGDPPGEPLARASPGAHSL